MRTMTPRQKFELASWLSKDIGSVEKLIEDLSYAKHIVKYQEEEITIMKTEFMSLWKEVQRMNTVLKSHTDSIEEFKRWRNTVGCVVGAI